MVFSAPLLVLGLMMTAVGVALIFLSLRPRRGREEVEQRGVGVVFIGPIPIVFGGSGKWAVIGVAVAMVIALLLVAASKRPDLIGW